MRTGSPAGGCLRDGSRRGAGRGLVPCAGTGPARSATKKRDGETWSAPGTAPSLDGAGAEMDERGALTATGGPLTVSYRPLTNPGATQFPASEPSRTVDTDSALFDFRGVNDVGLRFSQRLRPAYESARGA
jgi:hypothetical protein